MIPHTPATTIALYLCATLAVVLVGGSLWALAVARLHAIYLDATPATRRSDNNPTPGDARDY